MSKTWDASQIKQPGWHHVQAAFIEGAREARANPDADEQAFSRAADGYTKRVFEEVDPVSEAALRTGSWSIDARLAAIDTSMLFSARMKVCRALDIPVGTTEQIVAEIKKLRGAPDNQTEGPA